MKKLLTLPVLCVLAICCTAQTSVSPKTTIAPLPNASAVQPLDKSPMDMAYFPVDYPMLKTQNKVTGAPLLRAIFSRPQRDGRKVFGELVEYGKVWRMGANEATEIEFFKDAVIAGKKIPKGRYTLYAIPSATKWTMILNKDTDSWGAFVYDQSKDILRTDVSVQTLASPVEAFSLGFTKADKGANLVITWESVTVSLPIDIK